MDLDRRRFIGLAAGGGAVSVVSSLRTARGEPAAAVEALEQAAAKPVLKTEAVKGPVGIVDIRELLRDAEPVV